MAFQLQSPFSGGKCLHHMLFSIIYISLCILLVFLGAIWCSASHAHHQKQPMQLPNNLQNHRLSPLDGPIVSESKESPRVEPYEPLEPSPPPVAMRRSYQSSGFGNDYSTNTYGSQSGYGQGYDQSGYNQQQYGQYPQQSSSTGRQMESLQFGGAFYPGMGGGGGGLFDNRFLSLFPRRSSFYQPYYPYGPFGSSQYPAMYPYSGYSNPYGNYPLGAGLGGYGPLARLAQAAGLLTGGLQQHREVAAAA